MSVNSQEALAYLQVLTSVAKADGQLLSTEQEALAAALKQLKPLPAHITLERLMTETVAVDQALSEISTPELQRALYQTAYAIAHIEGITPSEQQLLDTIQVTFKLDQSDLEESSISIEQLTHFDLSEPVHANATLSTLNQDIRHLILDYAIGVAILGFNPVPGLNTITTLGAYILILKMMRTIGAKWGYPKGQDTMAIIGNIFGGLGAFMAGLTTWIGFSLAGMMLPIVGNFAASSYFFTITWALGQATHQFYASGCQMDATDLKKVFQEAKKEGKIAYKANQSVITEKQKSTEQQIQTLNQALKLGKISQKDYQEQLEKLF